MRRGKFTQYVMNAGVEEHVTMLMDALQDNWGKGRVQFGNLSSDYTFEDILPMYIRREYGSVDDGELRYEEVD